MLMLYVMVGSLIIGVAGIAFGVSCYYKLWEWARQMQGARIIVAYKRKVKINAPLVEWMLWANNLDKDKDSNGRTIYTVGGTSVAILKRSFVARSPSREFARWLLGRIARRPQSAATHEPGVQVKEGTWTPNDKAVAS